MSGVALTIRQSGRERKASDVSFETSETFFAGFLPMSTGMPAAFCRGLQCAAVTKGWVIIRILSMFIHSAGGNFCRKVSRKGAEEAAGPFFENMQKREMEWDGIWLFRQGKGKSETNKRYNFTLIQNKRNNISDIRKQFLIKGKRMPFFSEALAIISY